MMVTSAFSSIRLALAAALGPAAEPPMTTILFLCEAGDMFSPPGPLDRFQTFLVLEGL